MGGYKTILDPDILNIDLEQIESELSESELDDPFAPLDSLDLLHLPEEETQNIAILAVLLVLGLTTNFLAFPVILFRRTKFGNGQFAVLVLCLTIADLLTVCCGLLGGLILEVGHMTWRGTSGGCSAYYFLTSWLLGLSNYLVSALLGMIHVKRSTGWVSRLQECRLLLLCIVLATLLPALTELLVRSTINIDDNYSICIITAEPVSYGLYVAFKLIMSHILPIVIVVITLLRPQTRTAKRFSTLFLGEGSACECGPSGDEYKIPHECPSIGTRPDLVTSHKEAGFGKATVVTVTNGKARTMPVREDPHRRRYKFLLSSVFLTSVSFYIITNLSFQVQSGVMSAVENNVSKYLVSTLYAATYLKQIINPLLLVYVEFFSN